MSTGRLRFAVLMDIAFSSFQQEFRTGIGEYSRKFGIDVIYFGIGGLDVNNPEDIDRMGFLEMLHPAEFDGIVIVSSSLINFGGERLLRERLAGLRPLPMVSIGSSILGEDVVSIDNRKGMRSIMRHLLDAHGYRKIAYVSGPLVNREAFERLETVRECLADSGVAHSVEWEYEGNFLPPSGEAAVAEFLDARGLKPDAIVCANDLMALGVWNALGARGISVPFDIAVTGHDDMRLSHAISHQFTTVLQRFDRLGYIAMERLHSIVTGIVPPPIAPYPTELRVRNSCGCMELDVAPQDCEQAQVECQPDLEQSRIIDEISRALDNPDRGSVYRFWTTTVRTLLTHKDPVDGLKEILYWIGKSNVKGNLPSDHFNLLPRLYSILLEECDHQAFVEHWRDQLFSLYLRVYVDRLQDSLQVAPTLSSHRELMDQIAGLLGVHAAHLVRFTDFTNMFAGSSLVYSGGSLYQGTDSGDSRESWAPGPGNWFPPRGCSYVANFISMGQGRFGYLLLESEILDPSVYDMLRIRLSSISKDILNLVKIHNLNADLLREVKIREEAELKLKDALALVEQLSIEDELTGLRNRRGFFALAEQQIKYLKREECGYFIIYADMDGLKGINDVFGHHEGDLAIVSAAQVLKDALRSSDIIARLGGDEFSALVCKAYPPNYETIKQRILSGCERKNAELAKPWRLSMSVGHYWIQPGSELSLKEMLSLADEELYREKAAKKTGRTQPPSVESPN